LCLKGHPESCPELVSGSAFISGSESFSGSLFFSLDAETSSA